MKHSYSNDDTFLCIDVIDEILEEDFDALLDEDFSKIARPLTKLLEKDAPFEFDDECQKAFELLKEKLTCAPVIVSPNWNLPFELMCDASDFAVGAVLGQKDEFDIEIKHRKGMENVAADHLSRIENDDSSDDSEVDDNFPKETLMEINTKDEPWRNLTFSKIPKALISDRGTHFYNKIIEKTMKRYGVNHRFSTAYHPQTSGQVENTSTTWQYSLSLEKKTMGTVAQG
ncbi:reverse transcriptase domain-containing protein [Tanacetum coccineum]